MTKCTHAGVAVRRSAQLGPRTADTRSSMPRQSPGVWVGPLKSKVCDRPVSQYRMHAITVTGGMNVLPQGMEAHLCCVLRCAQMSSDELSHPTVIARAITRPCMLRQRSVTGHLRRSLDHYADLLRIPRSTTCTRTVSLDLADGGHGRADASSGSRPRMTPSRDCRPGYASERAHDARGDVSTRAAQQWGQ